MSKSSIASPKGEAVPTPSVSLVNCRHPFGEALRFDAVVEGVYPDRSACLWLSQAGEPWSNVYVAIPHATMDCARAVSAAISRYHVGGACRSSNPIDVRPCWPGAPETSWQITV